ncbi:hypothetical protein JNUCC64_14225 [Streptomyces sp. JNUCC 64]
MIKSTLRVLIAGAVAATAALALPGTATARSAPNDGLCYQAHVQNIGWQDWRCVGEWAGTTGRGLNVESIRFSYPHGTDVAQICFKAHRANYGWDSTYQCLGKKKTVQIGTTGMNTPIEAIAFYSDGFGPGRGDSPFRITGDAHVKNVGWQGGAPYVGDVKIMGTTGKARSIEAFWFGWY